MILMVASVLNDLGASFNPNIPVSMLLEIALSLGEVSGNKVALEV